MVTKNSDPICRGDKTGCEEYKLFRAQNGDAFGCVPLSPIKLYTESMQKSHESMWKSQLQGYHDQSKGRLVKPRRKNLKISMLIRSLELRRKKIKQLITGGHTTVSDKKK